MLKKRIIPCLDVKDGRVAVSYTHLHFHDVKWLFHLVQGLVILLAYPAVTFLWRNVKKGTFGLYRRLYMSLAVLPIQIGRAHV